MTRYLLLGNAPGMDVSVEVAGADSIIQFNKMRYLDETTGAKTDYVFVANSGELLSGIAEHLMASKALLPRARVMLARNPHYYRLKRHALLAFRRADLAWCHRTDDASALSAHYGASALPFLDTALADAELFRRGMSPTFMPSAGCLALLWLKRRIAPGDAIHHIGFTHEGWRWHPWGIESTLFGTFSVATA